MDDEGEIPLPRFRREENPTDHQAGFTGAIRATPRRVPLPCTGKVRTPARTEMTMKSGTE